MRKILAVAVGLVLATGLFSTARAAVGVTAKVGTLGLGGDVTVSLFEPLNIRAGGNILRYEWDGESNASGGDTADKIKLKLNMENFPVLLDLHPFSGSGFRISGGAVFNNNEVTLSAVPGRTVEINDREYSITSLDGKIDFSKVAPYVGIGYGNAADRSSNWHFACEFGVMFMGTPEVTLHATASDPGLQPQLDADVEEQKKKYEDDVNILRIYPVISVGVSYTF